LGLQTVTGYEIGAYDRVTYVPSVQVSVIRYFRHSALSFSTGQGVLPGNGAILTSRNQFANGVYSYSTRRSNISFGGGFYRLSSLANNVSQTYTSGNFNAAYSYLLRRHLSANIRYDLTSYGSLFAYGGVNDSRITFGLSLSSKNIPLTLF
jgi:hypothetical protein